MAHGENAPLNITPGAIRFNTDSMKLEYFRIGMEGGNTSSYAGIGTLAAGEWVQITTTSPDVETGGTRGLFGGGEPTTDTIDYINIATAGNATDFGNLSQSRQLPGGVADRSRACFGGGRTPSTVDTIDFVTIASTGDATDFGNLTQSRFVASGASSSTRSLFFAGITPSSVNTVDYITIQSTGNAVDFGDTNDTGATAACQSSTRAVVTVGDGNHSTEYFTISTLGNAADFGDMHGRSSACSNAIRGLFGGDHSGTTNVIEYITIALLEMA